VTPEVTVPEILCPTPWGHLDDKLLSLNQFDAMLLLRDNLILAENRCSPNPVPKHVTLEDPDAGELEGLTADNRAASNEKALENNELVCLPCEIVI